MVVRYTSSTCSHDSNKSEVTFEGDESEIESLMKALTAGNVWIRRLEDGTIVEHPAFRALTLTDDDAISNHFQNIKSYFIDSSVKRLNRKKKDDSEFHDPSIYVQHIAGYHGDYRKSANLMESVGFECLRSRRGKDGKYWEMWYLPGAWAATGDLKDKTTDEIRQFLFNRINPGTIEIGGQVWGLSLE